MMELAFDSAHRAKLQPERQGRTITASRSQATSAMAELDHKALAAQILGDCEAISVFAGGFHDADEVPAATLSKLQRCKDHLDQVLVIFNEPS